VRVDALGPRTWLLGAVAGWAVLLLLLALLGMGGHVARLADDPSLVRALPALRPAPPPRIGPLAQYGEAAARPLFADTRRPQPFSLQPEGDGEEAPQFEFVLTSVLQAPGLQMAIIQPAGGGDSIRMKLGESPEEAQGWRLVELHPRSAVFEGPQGQKTLDLRTFDGTGGEAPTAVARPARDDPAGNVEPATVRDADAPVATEARPAPPANAAAPRPRPASPTANAPTEASTPPTSPEAQMEAIRRRIEARRAQLRAEARQKQQQQQDENP
jgi:general secretion pathway protein N